MRYLEILEATSANAAAASCKRARQQLAAADKKRSDASRRYQDDLARAREARDKATAELRKTRVPEADSPTAFQPVAERSARQFRDRHGVLLGWIEAVGRLLQAKDRHGSVLGWYDPRSDVTRDKRGRVVGSGDFLCVLIADSRAR
jgi:hypothetical protein